jgi:hypothetical protein
MTDTFLEVQISLATLDLFQRSKEILVHRHGGGAGGAVGNLAEILADDLCADGLGLRRTEVLQLFLEG